MTSSASANARCSGRPFGGLLVVVDQVKTGAERHQIDQVGAQPVSDASHRKVCGFETRLRHGAEQVSFEPTGLGRFPPLVGGRVESYAERFKQRARPIRRIDCPLQQGADIAQGTAVFRDGIREIQWRVLQHGFPLTPPWQSTAPSRKPVYVLI
jgi:hypothetical protein